MREEILQKVLLVRSLRPSFVPTVAHPPAEQRGLQPGRVARLVGRAVRRSTGRPYRAPRMVVAIASSTGGPSALLHLFGSCPVTTPAAFVVAQHMPDKFTRTFAERLDKRGPVKTVGGQRRRPGRPWRRASCARAASAWSSSVAGTSLKLLRRAPPRRTIATSPAPTSLFKSVAALGSQCVGVILTGMGDDGVEGARAIRDAGGIIIAESQETAVVNGMPGAAVRAGVASQVLPLPQIGDYLASLRASVGWMPKRPR